MATTTKALSLQQVRDVPLFLIRFFKNPVETMQRPLLISWRATLGLQVIVAALGGILNGAIAGSWIDTLISLAIFPLMALMSVAILTLFLYYFFAWAISTYLDIHRLYAIIAVAAVPYFLLHAVAGFLPPIDLIGFSLAAILVVVGLCEQFDLNRSLVIRLMVGVSVIFFALWSLIQILFNA